MVSPTANMGKSPLPTFVLQLEEARSEWLRRHPPPWTCGWRIVISPIIPYDSPPCYHSSMRHLFVLFIHLIAVLTQLLQPGGVRSLVAESFLLNHLWYAIIPLTSKSNRYERQTPLILYIYIVV